MIQPALIEWLQSSRWDEAIFLMIPGTSCLATISLSLRDKALRGDFPFHRCTEVSARTGLNLGILKASIKKLCATA